MRRHLAGASRWPVGMPGVGSIARDAPGRGCTVSVWSTARSPENHARHIRHQVDQCPHGSWQEEHEDENEEDT